MGEIPGFIDEGKEIIQPKEQVVVLLKPGATEYKSRLIEYLDKKNIKVINEKVLRLNKEELYGFYPHAEKVILERYPNDADDKKAKFERIFSENDVIALLVEGEGAIEKVNRLKRKVRGLLKLERPNDGIHASDSIEEAERESEVIWHNQ